MKSREKVLLRQFVLTNDADAFAALSSQYSSLVYGVCWRVLRDEHKAADAAQETFLQLLRHAHKIHGSVGSWLHRVATTKAIDIIRRDKRQREHLQSFQAGLDDNQEDWAQLSIHIDEALNLLDAQSRDIIIEHYLENRSTHEIARRKGLSQATISRKASAALQSLRQNLRAPGLVVTPAVMSSMFAENSAQAVPVAVVQAIGKMAVAGHQASLGLIAKASYMVRGLKLLPKVALTAGLLTIGVLPFINRWNGDQQKSHAVTADGVPASETRMTLSKIRRLAEKNQKLISLIKLDYTVRYSSSDPEARERWRVERAAATANSGRRAGGVPFSHSKGTWAQDGIRQHQTQDYWFRDEQIKRGALNVVTGEVWKQTSDRLTLMRGAISRMERMRHDYIVPLKYGFQNYPGRHTLQDVLNTADATMTGEEVIDGKKTCIVETIYAHNPAEYRVKLWMDLVSGVPMRVQLFRKALDTGPKDWKPGEVKQIEFNEPDSKNWKRGSEIQDVKLAQLSNGGWFPIEATRAVHFPEFVAYEHLAIDPNSISTERADIPDSLFDIDFPEGAWIRNRILDTYTQVGSKETIGVNP